MSILVNEVILRSRFNLRAQSNPLWANPPFRRLRRALGGQYEQSLPGSWRLELRCSQSQARRRGENSEDSHEPPQGQVGCHVFAFFVGFEQRIRNSCLNQNCNKRCECVNHHSWIVHHHHPHALIITTDHRWYWYWMPMGMLVHRSDDSICINSTVQW